MGHSERSLTFGDVRRALQGSALVTVWPQYSEEELAVMTPASIMREARERCERLAQEYGEAEARRALREYERDLKEIGRAAQEVMDDPAASELDDDGAYVAHFRATLQLQVVQQFRRALTIGSIPKEESQEGRSDLPASSDTARRYFWIVYDLIQEGEYERWRTYADVWRAAAKEEGAKGPKKIGQVAERVRKAFDKNGWHVSHTALDDLIRRVEKEGAQYV